MTCIQSVTRYLVAFEMLVCLALKKASESTSGLKLGDGVSIRKSRCPFVLKADARWLQVTEGVTGLNLERAYPHIERPFAILLAKALHRHGS
jgi:hypothetical protein